jgi:hypothetical protein
VIRILTIEVGGKGGLAHALLAHPLDFEMVPASAYEPALDELRSGYFDAVVLDMGLGDDAWKLLEWLQREQPRIGRFVIVEEYDLDLRKRLNALGVIDCLLASLDATSIVVQLTSGLAETCYGFLHNINLPAFMQLLEIERKTCSLQIESNGRRGVMFVCRGELIDTQAEGLVGEPAAFAIIGWLSGSVTIEHGCHASERTITKPISHMLMQALQYRDESGRSIPVEFDGDEMSFKRLQESLAPLRSEFPPVPRLPSFLARVPSNMALPAGSLGLALVDAETGLTLASEARPPIDMALWAESAATVLRQEYVTLATSAQDAELMELVVSTSSCCELIRPLPKRPRCFALLVFDPQETNLVMARMEVERLMAEYT